jgi:hypothetical protein
LGQYEEAAQWGTEATRCSGPTYSGYHECLVALSMGCSFALRGNVRGALEVIARLDPRIPETAPPWVLQSWQFHKADILLILGRTADAFLTARLALGTPPALKSSFFAGPFSRWLALTSKQSRETVESRATIKDMLRDLDRLDAIDRAEVLCASLILSDNAESTYERRQILSDKLARLPDVTGEHLIRLGMPLS